MRTLFSILVLSLAGFLTIMACGEQTATSSEISEEQQEPASIDSLPAPQIRIPGAEERLRIDYIRGQFEPSTHPQFERVDDRFTDGDGSYYLNRVVYDAFKEMHAAAALDSVPLIIISATRNFDRQRLIWEAKWRGERLLEGREKANEVYPEPADRARAILRYSSMPGTSRHHWGSDLDLNHLTNEYFDQGLGKKVYDWLTAHAASYGFCQPYTAGRPHGYLEERWHWSYLPLAQPLTDFAREQITDEMIEGFEGAETSAQISVIKHYVLGINTDCL